MISEEKLRKQLDSVEEGIKIYKDKVKNAYTPTYQQDCKNNLDKLQTVKDTIDWILGGEDV